jgi:hypothetical protein
MIQECERAGEIFYKFNTSERRNKRPKLNPSRDSIFGNLFFNVLIGQLK